MAAHKDFDNIETHWYPICLQHRYCWYMKEVSNHFACNFFRDLTGNNVCNRNKYVLKVQHLQGFGLRSLPKLIMFVTNVIFIDIRYSWYMHNIRSIVNNNKPHSKKYYKWNMKQPVRKIPSAWLNGFDWFLSMWKFIPEHLWMQNPHPL